MRPKKVSDRETVELGEMLTFQRGFDITKRQQCPGDFAVISSSGPNTTHNEYKVKGPGVVTGRKGTLGKVFFSERHFWPHDTTLWVKDFHGNCEKFSYYLLQTLHLEQYDCGASNPTINRNHIHRLVVERPPLKTQRNIASILSAYDDLIENNLRRIKILEEMAQNLYREWFVKFRFPGHEKVKMVESELGMIPDGWGVVRLSGVTEVNSTCVKKGSAPGNIVYVTIKSVSTGSIDAVAPMPFSEAPSRARRVVQHGDTIWSSVRPNRRSYSLVLNPPENMIVSTGFAVIRPMAIPYTYCYYATTTDDFAAYLTNRAKGAAYPAVSADDFEGAVILKASAEVLDQFHSIVEPMVLLSTSLRQRNITLRRARDLLLPKLISGEIDVLELDIEIEERDT